MSEAQHDPPTEQSVPLRCPVWNSPVLRLTRQGIIVRCKSCRHSARDGHLLTWPEIDLKRAELEHQTAEQQAKNTAA